MEKALLVDIQNCFSQLLCNEADFVLLEFDAFLLAISHEFVEIFLDVFEDEVGLVYHPNHLLEFYYIGMVHSSERFDFRQLQTLLPSPIFFLQPLNRDYLFGFFVLSLLNIAERSRAQFFQNLVLLHLQFK